MQDLLFEMDWVLGLRSPTLTALFKGLTELGSAWFAVVFLSLGFALSRRAVFLRVALLSALAALLNAHLKSVYALPRPDPKYRLIEVSDWSFPSGHAQHATVMWTGLGLEIGTTGACLAGALISLAVGFSRVYLGVHYLRDALAGMIIASLVLFYFRWLVTSRLEWWEKRSVPARLAVLSVLQIVWWALLSRGATLAGLIPTTLVVGFWGGLTYGSRWGQRLNPRWGLLITSIFVVSGLVNVWSGGACRPGPFGLGEHPAAIHMQFTLLGAWASAVAPAGLGRLRLRALTAHNPCG